MIERQTQSLRSGILAVLQTPFCQNGDIDFVSLERLVEDAIRSGVDGLLAPAVASEVDYLTITERKQSFAGSPA